MENFPKTFVTYVINTVKPIQHAAAEFATPTIFILHRETSSPEFICVPVNSNAIDDDASVGIRVG